MKTKLIFTFFMLTIIGSLLKGQEFFTQNLLSNLNNYSNGFGAFATHTSQNIPTGYGTLLGLRFWDGGGSDWRTQLAFGTDNNFYYRQSTNSNGASWTNWYKVYHSGNINRSDVGLTALNINTTRQGIGIDGSGFGNAWGIGKDNTMGLYFFEGGVNQYRMILKDGGNVGIGTTSPGAPLEIMANENDKGLIIGGNGKSTKLYLHVAGGDYGYLFMGGNTVIRGNGNESFFDGSIGIGVNAGSYKLNVAGKIRADEIVVNTTGADFVFDPTYKLRSLSELETFIRTNKHLPDIAPAKEMQENGVSSGEMQAKLLQKVEELTLYVIEKDKEIVTLKAENVKQLEEQKKVNEKQNELLLELRKEIENLTSNLRQYEKNN